MSATTLDRVPRTPRSEAPCVRPMYSPGEASWRAWHDCPASKVPSREADRYPAKSKMERLSQSNIPILDTLHPPDDENMLIIVMPLPRKYDSQANFATFGEGSSRRIFRADFSKACKLYISSTKPTMPVFLPFIKLPRLCLSLDYLRWRSDLPHAPHAPSDAPPGPPLESYAACIESTPPLTCLSLLPTPAWAPRPFCCICPGFLSSRRALDFPSDFHTHAPDFQDSHKPYASGPSASIHPD
ncbi:hypothetical protein K438DRAFT_1966373 [Mycena galopus ATCC 62051]|nr:hypothetical protein K438DRAFT_1966373 [Mycena galopus ATCC 62051]